MKTRRQVNEAAFRKVRRKQSRIRGAKPLRDKLYREWISTLGDVVYADWFIRASFMRARGDSKFIAGLLAKYPVGPNNCDCSHIGDTGRGMRQKCSDAETVPMSRTRHEEYHKLGRKAFEEKYSLNLLEIAGELRKKYLEERG